MKKKFVFLGEDNSINVELINKSHRYLKNKVEYILIGNVNDLSLNLKKQESKLKINHINNPLNFEKYNKNFLNIFNIEKISTIKYKNLLNQIEIANHLANSCNFDLVTLPINKSIFKKNIEFTGMTEYLAKINNKNTQMLMVGENFSIITLTTHINLKDVNKFIKKNQLTYSLKEILKQLNRKIYNFDFKYIKFLCYNPHCSEENTLGNEDAIISRTLRKFKKITGPYSADSVFKKINNKTLYLSMYHDQALIPFKILNKKGINLTLGLNYRRLSPAHGTAQDIKYMNLADTSSFIACMEY